MKSIQVKIPGGPEQMELVEVPKPTPGPQQALVRIAASGVNFIDVYFRTGLYKSEIPIALGREGAGTVEAVGADVAEVAAGDLGEIDVEAGVPLPVGDARPALHVRTLGHRGAEAGGTRHRAVAALDATFADDAPMRIVELMLESLVDAGDR